LASCLHLCASVTMTETGKVIAGLAESNGSLPPIDCGLTACIHWDQLRVQRLVTSMGSFYLFTFYWCDTAYLTCAEPLRHAGLSAAAETLVSGDVLFSLNGASGS